MSDPKGKSFTATSPPGECESSKVKSASGGSKGKPSRTRTASKGSSQSIPTSTTRPDEIIRHDISDHELTMLIDTNRDGLSEAMWCCVGAAIGLGIPVIEKIYYAFSDNKIPLDGTGLAEVILFSFCVGIAFTIKIISGKRINKSNDIANDIRNRRRV